MDPKLIALAAGAFLLLNNKARAATVPGRLVAVRDPQAAQDYHTPTGTAGRLAASLVGGLFGVVAKAQAGASGKVEAAREAGAAASKAGDPYYSTPASLPGWDSIVYGWTRPAALPVNLGAASAAYAAGNVTEYGATVDGVAASPMFDPSRDVDLMASYGFGTNP